MRLKANVLNSSELLGSVFLEYHVIFAGHLVSCPSLKDSSEDATTEEFWVGTPFDELSACCVDSLCNFHVTKIEAPRCIFCYLKN